jgi:probable HAF family extracellular repeat protein
MPTALLWCAVAILVAAIGPLAQQRPVPMYRIVDLGTLGGDSSEAAGINLLGDVVGTSLVPNGKPHAFLYRAGRMIDLGTLIGGTESYATAIADNGVIVGYGGINHYGPAVGEYKYQGFIWQQGDMRSIGAITCSPCSPSRRYGHSRTLAVNNSGIAVGTSLAGGFGTPTVAFRRLVNGNLEDIGRDQTNDAWGRPHASAAWAINDLGEITGVIDGQAFLMRDAVRQQLGVPPGFARSEGRAVNGKGQVAGIAVTATGTSRGFLWDLGKMQGLEPWPGDVSSEARALNIDGDVVGRSGNADFSFSRAMLWRGGVAVDLHTRVRDNSWTLQVATGINNIGQIVGTGRHDGQTRAFLLQP